MSIKYIGILMYDFPMKTPRERKEYRSFRKYIIKKGYYQMQKSIYITGSATKEKIMLMEKHLIKTVPKQSSIRTLLLTEEQFKKMKILSGEMTLAEIIFRKRRRLLEF